MPNGHTCVCSATDGSSPRNPIVWQQMGTQVIWGAGVCEHFSSVAARSCPGNEAHVQFGEHVAQWVTKGVISTASAIGSYALPAHLGFT